jgi:hypothetical protein
MLTINIKKSCNRWYLPSSTIQSHAFLNSTTSRYPKMWLDVTLASVPESASVIAGSTTLPSFWRLFTFLVRPLPSPTAQSTYHIFEKKGKTRSNLVTEQLVTCMVAIKQTGWSTNAPQGAETLDSERCTPFGGQVNTNENSKDRDWGNVCAIVHCIGYPVMCSTAN